MGEAVGFVLTHSLPLTLSLSHSRTVSQSHSLSHSLTLSLSLWVCVSCFLCSLSILNTEKFFVLFVRLVCAPVRGAWGHLSAPRTRFVQGVPLRMDASSGDIDPNACINPELLSVLQHQRNASSSRLAGQNVRDTRSQQAACTPTQQRQQQQQQRRPFSELQNDDTYDSHINGHTGSDRANRNQHRSGSTQQSTPEQKSGGRRSGGDQRQGHVNRDSRSKSCNSALFRDDVFRQRFFGSPRPDAGHDVFSGGRLAVCPIVVPSGPPDFNTLVPRKALCHQFCRRTRKWTHTECRVRLSRSPFAKGSVRHAYYLKIDKPRSKLPASSDAVNASGPPNRDTKVTQGCIGGLSAFTSSASRDGNEAESRGGSCAQTPHADSSGGTDNSLQRKFSAQPGTGDSAKRSQRQLRQQQLEQLPDHECLYVAKRAIDPDCEPSLYFRDVEMQQHCAYYAQLFNEYNPPRKVREKSSACSALWCLRTAC